MGVGMLFEVVEYVFELFFIIKFDGYGMGLGLSMVFGFVKQSGGYIVIDSVVGQGIMVWFYFLCCIEVVLDDVVEVYDIIVMFMGGCEIIFVVEDDIDVCLIVVDMLSQFGYCVFMVVNGQVVFEFMNSGMFIDLFFIDVIMLGFIKGGELLICVV